MAAIVEEPMEMTAPTHWREDWEELQRGLAARSALVLALLGCALVYQELARGTYLDIWLLLLLLAGLAALALVVLGGGLPSPWTLVAEAGLMLAAIAVASGLLGYPEALLFLGCPLVVASLVAHPLVAAGVLTGAVAVVRLSAPAPEASTSTLLLALAGLSALTFLHMGTVTDALRRARAQAEGGVALAHEVRLRQQEVNQLNKALRVANGLLKRSLAELALAQKEAQEARHLKEQFATSVSHELRTPLNIILGFIDVMQRYPQVYGEVNWTPPLRRDISEMQRSAAYLSDLVDDILDLARIQALKMPIRREQTDLRALIAEAASLAARMLQGRDAVSLTLELSDRLPSVYIDRTRIKQVLLNLLANSCRFTAKGTIVLRASADEDQVVISVSDSGPGIPPEQLDIIFDEFRQSTVREPDGQAPGGKGLGLAIAKRFVQMHGGSIWAESQPGRGSVFSFSLPLQDKQVVSLAPAPAHAAQREGEEPLVVLVDDEQGCRYVGRHLEHYRVAAVPDLLEARKRARDCHPHAIVINVPPDMADAQHGTPPPLIPEPVPVVQCSLPVGRWTVEEEGLFDLWLAKPVDSEKLLAALERFPGARRLLLVDDDRSFVRLIRRILEAQDGRYEVLWAYDGRDALAKLDEHPLDAVILDIAMPGLDGRSVARAIRESAKHGGLAIVAVTAVQPGGDARARVPRSFAVSSQAGLSEEDTLALIRACLERLRPAYALEPPAAESQGDELGTPAS